jgi:hypothetical protein
MTVSLVVSQLAGRAPRVYSRRLKQPDRRKQTKRTDRRRLTARSRELDPAAETDNLYPPIDEEVDLSVEVDNSFRRYQKQQRLLEELLEGAPAPVSTSSSLSVAEQQMRRRLLFNIEWDTDNQKMTDSKRMWAALRTEAINSLVRYFGSLNSGSIGWCDGTQWYNPKVDGKCGTLKRISRLEFRELCSCAL